MNQSRMPSPAILVAVLALVAALAGTAVAGPDASTSAITKKKVTKIATKQINKLAPGLSVASADTANTANRANTANTADTATNAQNAANANALSGVGLNSVVVGASDSLGGCDPASTTFVTCASVTLDLPRDGRVLGWADLQWHSDNAAPSRAECVMRVDGGNVGHGMFFGESVSVNTSALHERGVGGNFVTSNLTAGPHTFSVNCNEPESDIDIDQAAISVLLLGTS
jgi:hypothetical protein